MKIPCMFYNDLYREHTKIVKGEGVYIFDENGKKYLDATGGSNASVPIGHHVEKIINDIVDQTKKVSFVPMHLFSNEPAERLAEEIAKLSPNGLKTTWFVNSGSEATENAVKIARQFQLEKRTPSKYKVITRWQSYFGNTLGALAVSGHTFRRSKYIPLLKDMPHIPPAYCYRCWFNKEYPNCDMDCAQYLERVIKQEGEENVAAFIAEPIVGATTGATVPPKEYYPIIREICDKYDITLIIDEVQTGIGRTGKWFCIEHWKISPDIMTTAKGLSGGYAPLGAVIVGEAIMERFIRNKSNLVGLHTFSANPISCTVGLSVLKYIASNNLVNKSRDLGKYLLKLLKELQEESAIIGDVRGLGLMIGVEFVKNKKSKESYAPKIGICHKITKEAMERGAIVYPGSGTADGIVGDHILLTPPFIITQEQIEKLVSILGEAVKIIEKKYAP